jgi:hypothetical protein
MFSIGNTLAAACSWPAADAVVVVAAEVAGAVAAVAVAGATAAATAAGVGDTAAGTGMAVPAVDPGELAACAKSHKSAFTTNQTNPVAARWRRFHHTEDGRITLVL